jgi:hypothetical protein
MNLYGKFYTSLRITHLYASLQIILCKTVTKTCDQIVVINDVVVIAKSRATYKTRL